MMRETKIATIGRAHEYDAIVVGARPAGAGTALLLARAGWRVLLVDRSDYGADTLSTHALLRGGVLQLHRWGVLDAVRRAGTPPIARTAFHYGDDTVEIAVRSQDGVDALYAPRRTVLDRILVDAAFNAGVDVVHGARVTGLQRDAHGRVAGVRAQTPTTEGVAWAPIVIGADGFTSTIARLVGAPVEHANASASAFVYGYFTGLPSDRYDWYFRPGVSAGVIPTNGGVANVFVGLPPERFSASARAHGPETAFRTVLAEAAPEVAAVLHDRRPVARHRSFPGHQGYVRRSHGPGWALVGDAGNFKDPLTAHGITDALRDAELLARALLDSPEGRPDAASYQKHRDKFSIPFMHATAATAAYDWDLPTLQALHLDIKRAMDSENEMLIGFDAIDAVSV